MSGYKKFKVKEWKNVKVDSTVFEHRLLSECPGMFALSEYHTLQGMLKAAEVYEDLCTSQYNLKNFIYKIKENNINDKYIKNFKFFVEKTNKKLNLIKKQSVFQNIQ